ncbi:amino acid ABC transporter substrate-binding protein [Bosea sp. NBC_00550]|uniref:amino acid ABC transporter substrate-binding protein n=1 Tax=Bosea sp. NBC_00550 TaxID=2969621 RepID=UPI00222F84ED|nr:amino acid ABC transporter substrate-binding protein [Bosea sp. NBC_00550]UZF95800.1 amino acid ABC transporter substrate-binding protein [Bosea sp. NBC_00550]
MKRNFAAAIGGLFAFGLAASAQAQEVDSIVKKLRETNTITMGIREALYPYGFLDNDKKPSGYSVEFCQRIIEDIKAELKLPDLKVKYVPVSIQNRQALVANGTVDLECGGTVNTFGRNKQVDFSSVSYVSSSQLLVLKSSGIAKYEDLNGKIVAVATGGSSEPDLKKLVAEKNLNIRIQNVDDHAAALISVETRRADAYFSDNGAFYSLIRQSKNPEALTIVGTEYGYAPQGFMVPRLNPTVLWIVNHAMAKMFKSGEAEALFNKWFGPFGAQVSPKLRAAWATQSYAE